MKKFILIMLITAMLFQYGSFCVHGINTNSIDNISAKHAVLIEANSGSIIFGKSEHAQASMASTTKIMTALLLCEYANLDSEITTTADMVNVEGSSMGLKAGDKVHYRDLLYGMLLASGNDAANTTAISIAGSISEFAKLMNIKARQIGMVNTNFVTPSGLDNDNHYSTAYDMALLAREALTNSDFAVACKTKSAHLEYGNPPYKRTLTNHNKLLKMYDGCAGVKTGFTKKSGRCLVSCAEKDGKKLIAVTLNASDDWNDHRKMLDFGFANVETRHLDCPDLPNIHLLGGINSNAKITVDKASVSLLKSDFKKLSIKVLMNDVNITPLKHGDVIGCVKWQLNDVTIAESPITISLDEISLVSTKENNCLFWFKLMLSA